ncbi:MAG: acyl-ACP--UDP-N-acetylglucosamine O-acyltransferase [Candidatus Kapabacteria bacterium]|nr:acyl-ACP--UDP-N-acetylglucosamine O-acyltransferase [Candidatus Kapabacteria bacterium]
MVNIHPTAIVSSKAKLGENVSVGAFTIIEDDVIIADNTEIRSSVVLANGTRIGKDCRIHSGVVIATEPQDLKFKNEPTLAVIGDRTVLREYVTINRGTTASGKAVVGSDCLIMAYAHVAHDCVLGNHIIMANACQLAGHVELEDWVILGGVVKVHQFCKVGAHAMIGGDVKLAKDVAPYLLVGTIPPKVDGVNKIGLLRRGFSRDQINEIVHFYDIVLHSGLNTGDGIEKYRSECSDGVIPDYIKVGLDFINNSDRGIYR